MLKFQISILKNKYIANKYNKHIEYYFGEMDV